MKTILFAILVSISAYGQSYHHAEFSIGGHIDQYNETGEQGFERSYYPGFNITMNHNLTHGFEWLGTTAAICYNNDIGTTFNLGLVVRSTVFKDFLEIEFIPPMMNMSLKKENKGQYNTPFGIGFNFFRGKVKLSVRELFFKNGIVSRVGLSYTL